MIPREFFGLTLIRAIVPERRCARCWFRHLYRESRPDSRNRRSDLTRRIPLPASHRCVGDRGRHRAGWLRGEPSLSNARRCNRHCIERFVVIWYYAKIALRAIRCLSGTGLESRPCPQPIAVPGQQFRPAATPPRNTSVAFGESRRRRRGIADSGGMTSTRGCRPPSYLPGIAFVPAP